jgi:hypothetical protein
MDRQPGSGRRACTKHTAPRQHFSLPHFHQVEERSTGRGSEPFTQGDHTLLPHHGFGPPSHTPVPVQRCTQHNDYHLLGCQPPVSHPITSNDITLVLRHTVRLISPEVGLIEVDISALGPLTAGWRRHGAPLCPS